MTGPGTLALTVSRARVATRSGQPGWRGSRVSPGLEPLLAVALLVGIVALMSMVHLAGIARPLFLLGALGLGVRFMRRSPFAYLTFTLWLWSTAPFARRLVDFYGGFVFTNIMLIAPNAVALLMLKDIVVSRDLWRRPGAGVGLLALIPVVYGLFVSFAAGDVVPGLISAADWLTPLIYYFYVINLTPRIGEAEPYFKSFVMLNLFVLAIYGTYQYISPPPWDVQWVLDSKMITNGQPVPYGLKPFTMLNSPGPSALWLAMLVILSIHFRNKMSLLLLPIAMLVLGLTGVRTAMGVVAAGLLGACVVGQARVVKLIVPILVALVIAAGLASVLDPRVSQALIARLSTFNDLSQDDSARARLEIYAETPGLIAANPLGMGIGQFGRGARDKAASAEAGVVDSGPLEIYLALGWVGGTLYVAALVAAGLQAAFAARAATSSAALAFAMAAVGTTCAILSVNLVGLAGITIWLGAGLAIAIRANERANERMASGDAGPGAAPRLADFGWPRGARPRAG